MGSVTYIHDQTLKAIQCNKVIEEGSPVGSSVEAMRHYAGCVYRLYGTGRPYSDMEIIALKVLIVLSIAGFVIGIWKGASFEDNPDWADRLFGAFAFSALPWIIAFVIVSLGYALRFLIT